jgi:hypothetical protein
MIANEAQCRIAFSEELLEVVCHVRDASLNNLSTVDE